MIALLTLFKPHRNHHPGSFAEQRSQAWTIPRRLPCWNGYGPPLATSFTHLSPMVCLGRRGHLKNGEVVSPAKMLGW